MLTTRPCSSIGDRMNMSSSIGRACGALFLFVADWPKVISNLKPNTLSRRELQLGYTPNVRR